ncbi:sensor histidine kinase [Antribacter sp. KLBMP9083]|uniref:histidine kinase n=1 Tax=Antribacter soli TaxID=2910976 RepID=A0AA41QBA1_9MICO|nr:sensor histidine kinase [Antribacter soli]MCF4120098.1 sensor histidine kinase [Antribacter soli]
MGWYERLTRWQEDHRFLVDLGGTVLAALLTVPLASSMTGYGVGVPTALWSLAVLAPLPWARLRPVHSTLAVYAVVLAHMISGYPAILPADLFVAGALYTLTVYGPRWAYLTCAGAALGGSVLMGVLVGRMSGDTWFEAVPSTIFAILVFLAVFAFALVRRSRRTMLVAMQERAVRLEIERDQQAQIATAAERARIAREMHDIVAHSLSVVIAQADGGRYAAANDPEAASRALGTIAETGRAALADMRRLLGVLRQETPSPPAHRPLPLPLPVGGEPAASSPSTAAPSPPATTADGGRPPSGTRGGTDAGPAPLAPQPDVTEIAALVDQVRASGARVSLTRVGAERSLPPGVGLTLYRICQEALTNVLKHAGPEPRVGVLLGWGEREVELRVDDDGRGLAADGGAGRDDPDGGARAATPGYGLRGMQERAALFGGTLVAGPRPGGGFRVRFAVPVPPVMIDDPAAADEPVPAVPGPTEEP